MNSIKHLLWAALGLFAPAVQAADIPPVPAEPVILGATPVAYPAVRIGDIAPQFAFPGPKGKVWDLRERRGQKAVLLLLMGKDARLESNKAKSAEALAALIDTAADLRKVGVESVLIPGNPDFNIGDFTEELGLLALKDEKGEIAKLFNVGSTGLTLVAIDRAGFLRDVRVVQDVADLAPLMFGLAETTPHLEIGKPAPDFSITDMNGTVRRVSDLRGHKNLVLTFFPKCFTGGCKTHLTSLQTVQDTIQQTGTEIWAVSIDPARKYDAAAKMERGQLAFAQSLNLDFPMLPDTGRNVCLLYGTVQNIDQVSQRWTFLIDKDGILRYVDKAVQSNLATHGADILARMKELGMIAK